MKLNKNEAENLKQLISEETGVDKIIISQGRYFPKNIPDFAMMFQKVIDKVILDLTPGSCKVFLYMIGKLQYSNHIGVDQTTMSEECKLSMPTIKRAIKELQSLSILIPYKDLQDKRRNVYIINPHTAWKGTFKHRNKAIKQIESDNQLKLHI